jgi:uncharacterized membrane protein
MKQAVLCIVPTEAQADRIVYALRSSGFNNADVSVVMPDQCAAKDVGHEKHSKAPEGATTGGVTGLVLGGALGWLAGVGALAIPGLGPFVAAGPIMATLGGAAVGGTSGGVIGSLIGLGIPEIEAKQFETKLRDGNILLSVHTENGDEAKRVEEIFKAEGASDICKTSEEKVKRK